MKEVADLKETIQQGEAEERVLTAALDRALDFALNSQYPNGGWPQRWP